MSSRGKEKLMENVKTLKFRVVLLSKALLQQDGVVTLLH